MYEVQLRHFFDDIVSSLRQQVPQTQNFHNAKLNAQGFDLK